MNYSRGNCPQKRFLVGIDRDGTINEDTGDYLGARPSWKDSLRFCKGAVRGLEKLTSDPGTLNVVVTNQAGIAKRVITEARLQEVHEYMASWLVIQGIHLDGWLYSPHATPEQAERWRTEQGIEGYDECLVGDFRDRKPGIGMLERAAELYDARLDDLACVYVIGDRASDVETALNAGGVGILVNRPEHDPETLKVCELRSEMPGRVMIAADIAHAASLILEDMQKY
ncbi:HAD-IIIA family hydrolase [Candidatus Woesearchaeota archaeon]|nr:HAD-IIIA family hydrolase [Candidatus Woesearchaeota archaeon]